MEPRFFKRGNNVIFFSKSPSLLSLQWNHVFSNVEIRAGVCSQRAAQPASMEPRFFKRGNHRPARCHFKQCKLGFNGTTFFQTWKSATTIAELEKMAAASMEPRFFKRGNTRADAPFRGLRLSAMLQWNHVFSNVEIPVDLVNIDRN